MRHLGKNLGLLSAVGFAGLCAITVSASASVNTNSEELYSESIYIQKSEAEVPTSLESNARPKANSEQVAAASARAIESMSELDSGESAKKSSE